MEESSNTVEKERPVVLVTGGGRRTGAVICRAFAAAGWRVAVHCNRSQQEAEALAAELGGAEVAAVFAADLTDDRQRDGLVDGVVSCFGRLDAMVNNASAYARRPLETVSAETLRRDMEINFTAPFALMGAFRKAVSSGGSIVNILDSRIQWPDGSSAGYTLAKSALAQATVMLAREWAADGIRVNGVAPGFIEPAPGVPLERMQHLIESTPLKRRTTPEEIADGVLWLVKSPSVTGQILFLDGGLHLPVGGKGEKL
jgi:pteridine reductase